MIQDICHLIKVKIRSKIMYDTMLFICYSNLNIEYFSCNGIHILRFKFSCRERVFNNVPSVFKELSESESRSNFKFSLIFSLIDKSMFVLVLIVSKVF